jgi:hypothetical protein
MTLATEVKKLAESKPFYAVAGAGDYAVEKLRELPEQLQKLQARRGEFTDAAKVLPEKAREYAGIAADRAEVYAKDLPEKAREYADTLTVRANALYEDFASRGRKVVSRVTGEAALELEEVSTTAEPPAAAPAPTAAQGKKTTRKTTKA